MFFDQLFERQAEQRGLHRLPVLLAEDQLRLGVSLAERETLLELALPVFSQHCHRLRVEVDRAATLLGLRFGELHHVLRCDQRLLNPESLPVKVDVSPPQPEHLATPHPCGCCEVERRV